MRLWSSASRCRNLWRMPDVTDPDLDTAYALETPEDNLRLYRDWAETYDADFVAGSGFRFPRLIAEAYVAHGGGWPCLDVGCGTGAVAECLPRGRSIDGLDLSPDMLAVARKKGLYGQLIQANLKETLPISDAAYQGIVCSGTFTHGHVGAEALGELVRIMAPGGLAVISIRDQVWETMGFADAFARLVAQGRIEAPVRQAENVYDDPGKAPQGHGDDVACLTRFRRL